MFTPYHKSKPESGAAVALLEAEAARPGGAGHGRYPAPYARHPRPSTLHPTPYTRHLRPSTLNPTPYTLHLAPDTRHSTLPNPTLYTRHPTSDTRKSRPESRSCSARGGRARSTPDTRFYLYIFISISSYMYMFIYV